jgi:hypothetical protein
LEIDQFEKFINVDVWDLTSITGKQDSINCYHLYDNERELIPVKSWLDFIAKVLRLRRELLNKDYYILNELNYRTPSQVLCNLILFFILKRRKVWIIELINVQLPIGRARIIRAAQQDMAAVLIWLGREIRGSLVIEVAPILQRHRRGKKRRVDECKR